MNRTLRRGSWIALFLLLPGCAAASQTPGDDRHMEVARRVLSAVPLVDGHNDLPWVIRQDSSAPRNVTAYDLRRRTPGHTDIDRLRQGMLGVQFWSVYVAPRVIAEGAAKVQLEQIDIAKQIFATYPDVFEETLTSEAALAAFRQGRIGSVMGMEGGHVIENSLGALRAFYELGARYLTLTHSENTDWADAATDRPRHNGLTAFGREVVREMNRLGMLVDLSHVHELTMHAALDVSEAPVIFSHSSVRGVTDVPRNVPDSVLRRLRTNGGVVMITFVPQFISQDVADWSGSDGRPRPRATLADAIRHIEYARDVAGIDHIGIGGDFDGIESVPVGLEDVSAYPALFAELSRRGWSEAEMRKLAGENILRAWSRAEEVARRLQRERGPSTATIEQLDRR
jgi:membrane dipeptidase